MTAEYRPSDRLHAILARISHDTVILPDDFRKLSVRIAKKICPGYEQNILRTVPQECDHVGMIRGKPCCYQWDSENYLATLKIMRNNKTTKETKLIKLLELHKNGGMF